MPAWFTALAHWCGVALTAALMVVAVAAGLLFMVALVSSAVCRVGNHFRLWHAFIQFLHWHRDNAGMARAMDALQRRANHDRERIEFMETRNERLRTALEQARMIAHEKPENEQCARIVAVADALVPEATEDDERPDQTDP